MSFICNFCTKTFKTKSSLNYHQLNAKFCLELQNKKQDKFKCDYCHKILSSKHVLEIHISKCQSNQINQDVTILNEDNIKLGEDIIKLTEANLTLIEENRVLHQDITKMKSDFCHINDENIIQKILNENYKEQIIKQDQQIIKQDQQIKDLIDKLERLATRVIDRPSSSNTTVNNKIIALNVFPTQQEINQKIQNRFDDSYLWTGIRGVAQFVYDHIIKLEDGSMVYACFDTSRQIFKYKDKDGNEIKDIKATKLTKMIQPGLIEKTKVLYNHFNEECEYMEQRIDKGLDYDKNQYDTLNLLRVKAFDFGGNLLNIDETKFALELASLTCI